MRYLNVIMIMCLLLSCKSRKPNLSGDYDLSQMPSTKLRLHADSTFEFICIYRNPYLHPFEHPDRYFTTYGKWSKTGNKYLILNSDKRKSENALIKIDSTENKESAEHNFVFIDINRDTIPILFVAHKDSSITSVLHRKMPSYTHDVKINDNLEFAFFGYDKFLFSINNQTVAMNYTISMAPASNPGYFKDKQILIRNNSLIDVSNKAKFKRHSK